MSDCSSCAYFTIDDKEYPCCSCEDGSEWTTESQVVKQRKCKDCIHDGVPLYKALCKMCKDHKCSAVPLYVFTDVFGRSKKPSSHRFFKKKEEM